MKLMMNLQKIFDAIQGDGLLSLAIQYASHSALDAESTLILFYALCSFICLQSTLTLFYFKLNMEFIHVKTLK
jgi:hypothetical protein